MDNIVLHVQKEVALDGESGKRIYSKASAFMLPDWLSQD
jgi:hypothetical protein